MSKSSGTFDEFKRFTIDVARGTRKVDPAEPKIWVERVDADDNTTVQFRAALGRRAAGGIVD